MYTVVSLIILAISYDYLLTNKPNNTLDKIQIYGPKLVREQVINKADFFQSPARSNYR